LAYKTNDWGQFVPSPKFYPFVFDASNESIEGITSKIEYLNRTGASIENVLIIICSDVTFNKDGSHKNDHLYIKHPMLSDNSAIKYYFTFFATYLKNGFFIKYLDYKIFRVERNYMADVLDLRRTQYNTVTNDLYLNDQEASIEKDSLSYYEKHKYTFYTRPEKESICNEQISKRDIFLMNKISLILTKHSTNYRIIIGPLYDQKKLNPSDLNTLIGIFGKENIFDYSGINSITTSKYNYLENSHYRYRVGRKIMQEIYQNTN
jgi:hypothetical protein